MKDRLAPVEARNPSAGANLLRVAASESGRDWTFLSNHGHVLLAIAGDPEVRLRDIATRVGITERAVQLIVADLVDGGYIAREKVGRRNRYTIMSGKQFRHPAEQMAPLDELIDMFRPSGS